MDAAELKSLLKTYGINPIRDRGQHFLLDGSVVERMTQAAEVRRGDKVVEIGPGPGILTEALLGRGAEVTAIEIDMRFMRLLRERFAGRALTLIEADARAVPNATFGDKPYKVVANIPYNITSATLEKFLLAPPLPVSITVMVQKEVAERITAGAGEMGSLSVLCQALAEPAIILRVPRSAFLPPPKVDSAVVHLRLRDAAELARIFFGTTPERVFALSRAAFSEPRKQLKNTLLAVAEAERLTKAFAESGVAPSARPETLTVAQWAALAASLDTKGV